MKKNHFNYWCGISAILMDTDEGNHLMVNITVDTPEDLGLSESEKLTITEVWQHPQEGIITFKTEGCKDEFDLSDFPELFEQIYAAIS